MSHLLEAKVGKLCLGAFNPKCFSASPFTKLCPIFSITTTAAILNMAKMHVKCRNAPYPRDSTIIRFTVPDDKVSWDIPFPEYKPVKFTTPKVLEISGKEADPNIMDTNAKLSFGKIDGKLDRTSFQNEGKYRLDGNLPLNPIGRTGIVGRGALYRWGANHAGDPIVTRWKRNESNEIVKHPTTKKPILQFVSILRGDTKEWAIPGGMVDPGEHVTTTLKREFAEEAMDSTKGNKDKVGDIQKIIEKHFKNETRIYQGYVDDPRNTDNAWMETVAYNFHDDDGTGLGQFSLHAGDDAVGVRWCDVDSDLKLYASHKDFIEETAKKRGAHW